MEIEELQQWILNNLYNKEKTNLVPKRVSYKAKWVEDNPKIYQQILDLTSFLPDNSSLSHRIYHIIHNLLYRPVCKKCKTNYVKYQSFYRGYSEHCSQKCVNKTRNEKFQEKYNCTSPLQVEKFKQKSQQTKLNRYNDIGYNNHEQISQTLLEKYGYGNPLQIDEFKQKQQQTNFERYGVEYPQLNEKIRNKSIKTLENKYGKGISNPFQSQEVQEQIRKDRQQRTGFEYNSQEHITNLECLTKEYVENEFIDENYRFNLNEFQNFFNLSKSHSYIKLKYLQVKYDKTVSVGEGELQSFVGSLTNNAVFNTREIIKPKELDIFIPDHNLAIEYNGNYWHCDENFRMHSDFHVDKTNECENKNIQLIHIFEHQWKDVFTRDIIKSMIVNKLGKSKVLYGRKCRICEINPHIKNNFLKENHIQGTCNSNINIGLYYENDLVSVMTFGKPRFNKDCNWELLRFCNKKYHTVVGGSSKLFNFFINSYRGSVITYADRTYSKGDLYNTLGFSLIQVNKPSYFYFKNEVVLSRYKTQKKKLSKILDNFNPDLTEYENMLNNGFHRVWDCGMLVYKYY